jgi:heme A synthase
VLSYTLLVVLWGAFVRATGAGAGCGSHWPKCNGVLIPRPERIETVIEFSHRLTSGLLGFLMLGLVVGAFLAFPRGHGVRRWALWSLFFTVAEGLIGGLQVLAEMTADNASPQRAIWQSAHLANTFLLIGALALTAWRASGGQPLRLRRQGPALWLLSVGLLGAVLLGVSGTIAALGDTLFPVESLREGLAQDFAPTAHFLIRLRVWHPFLAVTLGAYLVAIAWLIRQWRPDPMIRRLALTLSSLFTLQLLIGSLNVVLLAPVWMQLVHLLMADLVWIALVLLSAATLSQDQPQHAPQSVRSLQPGRS